MGSSGLIDRARRIGAWRARLRRFAGIALSCALILGCQQTGHLSAPASGLSGSTTRAAVISDHPHHVLTGRLVDMTSGDTRLRALVVAQRFDGVHRLHMTQARMGGADLPFRRAGRGFPGCAQGRCTDHPVGTVFLSDAVFAAGLRDGLHLSLVGREGAIALHVPRHLFAALPRTTPAP